jgi:cell division protein FtsQ
MAAIGRLDLSPRAVVISIAAGALVLAGLLATGARAERIGASIGQGVEGVVAGMGLKLEKVFIEGESPEATAAIQRAVQLPAGQAMTSIDLDAVRQRVEQVGWVKSARVVRLLPNTLIVAVTEHDRLAVWQTGGKAFVIDGQGQVIPGADPGRYPALPLVVGKGAEQAAAEILPLLAQRPRLMGRTEALVRVDERRWDLRLKDGSLIQLPASDQEAALIQLDALDQRERLLELGFARIDLRTPEEVAVRPSAGEA